MINIDKHLYFNSEEDNNFVKTINKYYEAISETNERYTIQGTAILNLLDIKPQYFNKIFSPNINSIYLDKPFRNFLYNGSNKINYIKSQGYSEKEVNTINDKILELLDSIHIDNKVAYSEESLRSAIKEYFYTERIEVNEEGLEEVFYDNITEADIDDILKFGVLGTTTLKEKLGVKYDMQLYRILRNTITHKKFVIIYNLECQNKRLARYLFY